MNPRIFFFRFFKPASLISLLMVTACKQKIRYSGTVYSQHNVRIANAQVFFGFSVGSMEAVRKSFTVYSDEHGDFALHEKIPHNAFLKEIVAYSADSGEVRYYGFEFDDLKNINIHLEQ